MKQGVVSSKKLFRRLDVKYHFNENKEIDNYDKLCDLKELIVRDPNCYGFRYSSVGIPMIRISDIGNPFINYDNESSTLNWTNSMRIDIVNLRK